MDDEQFEKKGDSLLHKVIDEDSVEQIIQDQKKTEREAELKNQQALETEIEENSGSQREHDGALIKAIVESEDEEALQSVERVSAKPVEEKKSAPEPAAAKEQKTTVNS